MSTKQPINDRFSAFLLSLGSEAIDQLNLTEEQASSQHADFLLRNRQQVVEVKLLSTDTRPRMAPVLAPYEVRPEFALLSRQSLDTKLELLPDGDQLRDQLHKAVTESIEGLIKKANRQIRHTRRTFAIPRAGGILVVLNDEVGQLSPPIVSKRAAQVLQKRVAGGVGARFAEIDTVWIVNEAHYVQVTSTRKAVTDVILPTFTANAKAVAKFVATSLSPAWASYNGKAFAQFGEAEKYLEEFRFIKRPK